MEDGIDIEKILFCHDGCLTEKKSIPSPRLMFTTVLQAGQGTGMSKRALPAPHPTFLRIIHTPPHFSLTRSYVSMPPTAKPNRGDWLLRSKTTRPAFSRCRPAATVRRAALSLRIWSGTPSLLLEARRPQAGSGEGLRRTRHFHLVVLSCRSASLWPTTNRWFFGKASTRSNRLCQLTPQK